METDEQEYRSIDDSNSRQNVSDVFLIVRSPEIASPVVARIRPREKKEKKREMGGRVAVWYKLQI